MSFTKDYRLDPVAFRLFSKLNRFSLSKIKDTIRRITGCKDERSSIDVRSRFPLSLNRLYTNSISKTLLLK